MRSIGVVVILAVAIALSISMLIARDAVTSKINSVKSSTGTTEIGRASCRERVFALV